MSSSQIKNIVFVFVISFFVTTSCGISPEEQELISLGETALAATPCQDCPEILLATICPDLGQKDCQCQDQLPFMHSKQYDSIIPGRVFNIRISLPSRYYERTDNYRTIYVLDGDILFGTTSDVVHSLGFEGQIPDAIVVGIGYNTESVDNIMDFRYQDTTTGGQNYGNFTNFLIEDLIPWIESNYRADPTKRTILGHSLTGLYPLTIMFDHPDVFSDIISSSPSLFLNDREIFDLEESYWQNHQELPANIFFSIGEKEYYGSSMDPDLEEFIAVLDSRGYSGFSYQLEIISGENHVTVIPYAISKGIRATSKWY